MAPCSRTLGSTAGLGASRRLVTQEEMEAHWASLVTGPTGEKVTQRSNLMIKMAGQIQGDSNMDQWCSWFLKFVKSTLGPDETFIKEVNFSGNKLSTKGAQRLFSTLKELKARINVIKLFQNGLEKPDDVLDFIVFSEGNLRELHLSHNQLDTTAVRDIIMTAAAAKNASGDYLYPRTGCVPLWLRLEGNNIDPGGLFHQLKSSLSQIGRPYERSICEVDATSKCNPGCCNRCSTPPPIHITYLRLCEHASKTGALPPSVSKASCLQKLTLSKASVPEISDVGVNITPPPGLTRKGSNGTPESSGTVTKSYALVTARGWGSTPKQDSSPGNEDKPFNLHDDFPSLLAPSGVGKAKSMRHMASIEGSKSMTPPATATFPMVQPSPKVEAHGETQVVEVDSHALTSIGKERQAAPKHPDLGEVTRPYNHNSLLSQWLATPVERGGSENAVSRMEGVPSTQHDASAVESLDGKRLGHREVLASDTEVGDQLSLVREIDVCKDDWTDATDASEHNALETVAQEEFCGWTAWIAFQDYEAEAHGYLSVSEGQQIAVYNVDLPSASEASCAWHAYVFAVSGKNQRLHGWLPVDILATRYHDEQKSCNWLFVPTTEQARYETIGQPQVMDR